MIQPKDELIRDTKISGIKKQVAYCINAAFSKGYETCFEQKKEIEDRAYQKGLEDGKKQGAAIDGDKRYWDGYHAAQEDGKKIYQKGYEEGARCQDEVQYQKGLDDAWACVRRLSESRTHKEWEELYAFFGVRPFQPQDIFKMYTASEAIEKIRAYEEKQKHPEKVDCDNTDCQNCTSHNYCDYEEEKQKEKIEIKVGTKVRTTKDKDHSGVDVFPIGTVGTVTEIAEIGRYRYKVSANGDYWRYSADMFEVIEEDEKQEELQDDEIKIGDEVIYDGRTGVVDSEPYHIGVDRELFVSIWFGGGMASAALANVKKTGRHFDGIEDALKQMSRFSPTEPSDEKPCAMCPAEGKVEL